LRESRAATPCNVHGTVDRHHAMFTVRFSNAMGKQTRFDVGARKRLCLVLFTQKKKEEGRIDLYHSNTIYNLVGALLHLTFSNPPSSSRTRTWGLNHHVASAKTTEVAKAASVRGRRQGVRVRIYIYIFGVRAACMC
jgi:hypothetical protein